MSEKYRNLYNMTEKKEDAVADMCNTNQGTTIWNSGFKEDFMIEKWKK